MFSSSHCKKTVSYLGTVKRVTFPIIPMERKSLTRMSSIMMRVYHCGLRSINLTLFPERIQSIVSGFIFESSLEVFDNIKKNKCFMRGSQHRDLSFLGAWHVMTDATLSTSYWLNFWQESSFRLLHFGNNLWLCILTILLQNPCHFFLYYFVW